MSDADGQFAGHPMTSSSPKVAVVDYGMGNLFSVVQAFSAVGQSAAITSDAATLAAADAIVIPGVGAFGRAMDVLERSEMADAIRRRAREGTPIVGICLGMQLMMSSSTEFGSHGGLDLIAGETLALKDHGAIDPSARIPHVGWTAVQPARAGGWCGTPLATLGPGHDMYFVHSFYVRPADPSVALAFSTYRGVTFCSSLAKGNLFGCQFHPERSGPEGLEVYRHIAASIRAGKPFGGVN
jgi:imidazole glycerol-phosphate synthase subunit HisH